MHCHMRFLRWTKFHYWSVGLTALLTWFHLWETAHTINAKVWLVMCFDRHLLEAQAKNVVVVTFDFKQVNGISSFEPETSRISASNCSILRLFTTLAGSLHCSNSLVVTSGSNHLNHVNMLKLCWVLDDRDNCYI